MITDFEYNYTICPITLVGGVANIMQGGMMPIVALTEPGSFANGVYSPATTTPMNASDFFATYKIEPGSTLLKFRYGQYPYANQNVAANAAIADPLTLSVKMICPAKTNGGYTTKQAVMTSLKQTLQQHVALGGSFIYSSPALIYDSLLLNEIRDQGPEGADKQVQNIYIWEFWQPLLTVAQADQAANSLMTRYQSGAQVLSENGMLPWSGLSATQGQPGSVVTSSVVPAASGAGAAQISAPAGPPL